MRAIIFDIETDGLLDTVSQVHVMAVRVIEDGAMGPVEVYRADRMRDALDLLNSADMVIGHNIVGYDIPALEKIYPDWRLGETVVIRDTMVMARMCFADEKDRDFRRFERGTIRGADIGKHTLDSWGQRLGLHKGDYKKVMEARAKEQGITDPDAVRLFVWGTWNQEMEDYCINDVEVTTLLWEKIERTDWSPTATRLEHRIHYIMFLQEQFGFVFDSEMARDLEREVTETYEKLVNETIEHFGFWYAPEKIYRGEPREGLGEDDSRKFWGEVKIASKNIRYKDPKRHDRIAGAPYCPLKRKDFNPRSRPMVVDRLKTLYQWEPVDFTESGAPSLDDDVLENLEKHIPICAAIREIFFYNKLLGALANGENAWLKKVGADGRMHGYVNTGGTVSGRGSHQSPNMGQVPKVKVADVLDKEGKPNPKHLNSTGKLNANCYKADGSLKKAAPLLRRAGRFGWECRSLFTVPDGWWLMGCDMSGIELRCFGARLHPYDDGAYLDVVLNGDVHTNNQHAAGLESRDQAKTFIYATLYGGGDEKVGSIVLPPSASSAQMKARGRQLKSNFEQSVPAYRQLIRNIAAQARRGYLIALDGRKLFVRSKHAALNLQLQSDAALLSKAWIVIFFDMMEEAGYVWGEDWGLCAWVHDEIQAACRTREIAEHAARLAVEAAAAAGYAFDYPAPVGAEAKIGKRWSETH